MHYVSICSGPGACMLCMCMCMLHVHALCEPLAGTWYMHLHVYMCMCMHCVSRWKGPLLPAACWTHVHVHMHMYTCRHADLCCMQPAGRRLVLTTHVERERSVWGCLVRHDQGSAMGMGMGMGMGAGCGPTCSASWDGATCEFTDGARIWSAHIER